MSRKAAKDRSDKPSDGQEQTPPDGVATELPGSGAKKSRRGFASMERTRLQQLASNGGMIAQANGLAHRFSSESARLAGRKGGAAVSADRSYMAELGRRGGLAKSEAKKKRQAEAGEMERLAESSRSESLSHDGQRTANVAQQESGAQVSERQVVEIASPPKRRSSPRRHRKRTQSRRDG